MSIPEKLIALGSAAILGVCSASAQERVTTVNGILEGVAKDGIRAFKGIPFAQPPVGDLRWRPPQPPKNWEGVRKADQFGPRAMQRALYGDMIFRSNGMSEDCLYLNIWTPAHSNEERLPVLVYFFGGGFQAGDGSEGRYDGESMARKGIVTITVNYRLGIFGFFAHPELSKEQGASGNYGLMDQNAALRWVRENIASFGGDPTQVTIAGESAGSMSVSAQMASPLSRGLFARAIGQSGALLGKPGPMSLVEAEGAGAKFAASIGAGSLAELRSLSAEKVLEATALPGAPRWRPVVDGHFLPKDPVAIFASGEQAPVPLLAGWNSQEGSFRGVLGEDPPTVANFAKAARRMFGGQAEEALKVYAPTSDAEAEQVATDLASDRFIAFGAWRWTDLHAQNQTVYRFFYAHPRPGKTTDLKNPSPGPIPKGAVHASDIEYALGNLDQNAVYAWTADDRQVSETMQEYFANFIKTGDPNGSGLPLWPQVEPGKPAMVMRIDRESKAALEQHRDRYLFLAR